LLQCSAVGACKDFDELQLDPNRPVQAQPSLLLTGIETRVFRAIDVVFAACVTHDGVLQMAPPMSNITHGNVPDSAVYDELRQIGKMVKKQTERDWKTINRWPSSLDL
jgi:hypothetical protein